MLVFKMILINADGRRTRLHISVVVDGRKHIALTHLANGLYMILVLIYTDGAPSESDILQRYFRRLSFF